MSNYSITGLKTFRGNEGYGFNANLLIDGRKVAFVYDDANGGCYRYEWVAKSHEERDADRKALDAHAASLPRIPFGPDMGVDGDFQPDCDYVLDQLVQAAQVEKQFNSAIKSKVVMARPDGVICSLRNTVKPTADTLTKVAAHPNFKGYRILNSLPRAEALALFIAGTAA